MKIEDAMEYWQGSKAEAVKYIGEGVIDETFECQLPFYDMAIKALERQMPKEPAHKDGDYFCQVCGTYCGNVHDGMQKYCDECGQRLK